MPCVYEAPNLEFPYLLYYSNVNTYTINYVTLWKGLKTKEARMPVWSANSTNSENLRAGHASGETGQPESEKRERGDGDGKSWCGIHARVQLQPQERAREFCGE